MRHLLNKLKRVILNLGALAYRTETTDSLVLLLVFSAGWWMTAQQGGSRAESLPAAMRLLLAAVIIHGASLLIRQQQGVRLSLAGLLFLPFVGWLAFDAACFAPDRGPALVGLIVAAMLAIAWHLVLHHARRTWSFVTALTLLIGPAAILACGSFDHDDRHIRGLLGMPPNPAYLGHFISAMGTPGACAAVMLLALMPTVAVALNPRLKTWMRIVAAYFGTLLLLGLVGTHHVWAWSAFALGLVVLLWQVCKSNQMRASVAAITALTGWLLASDALVRVGVLRTLNDDPAQTPWLARAAWQAIQNHPLVGGGAGSFALNFESTRPPTWQTDPVSCGSLPLQLLCEHGLLGAVLILAPACWIAWHCLQRTLTPDTSSTSAIIASGGHRRAALRKSLSLGAILGSIGAGCILAVDYPCSLPGVLLLLTATAAIAQRLSQDEESRVAPDHTIAFIAYGCLVAPVLAAPILLSPVESAAIANGAKPIVAAASPTGLASPRLLDAESQKNLSDAADQLDLACRLNPLSGETHAWHAQSLGLLVRQSPQDQALQGRARLVAEEAVQLNPRSAWTHAVLGSILLGANESQQRAKGLSHLKQAAELAPMNQAIALRLAQALGQTGAPANDLRAAYERAQLTNPNRAEVRDKLTLLKATEIPSTPSH